MRDDSFLTGGIAVGLALAPPGTRALANFIAGVKPTDPATFITVATMLSFVAVVACWIAACRAVSILEKTIGKNHPRIASALNNLAVVCARRGNFGEAVALYRRSLKQLPGDRRSSPSGNAIVKGNLKRLQRSGKRVGRGPASA